MNLKIFSEKTSKNTYLKFVYSVNTIDIVVVNEEGTSISKGNCICSIHNEGVIIIPNSCNVPEFQIDKDGYVKVEHK